jgi:hypothetical protein
MHLVLTPKTALGLTLGATAVAAQVAALRIMSEDVSEVVTQRETLATIVGKHADVLDEFDRETLRKMGIAIKSKALGSGG